MATDPERPPRPQTLAQAKGTQWPVCLCTSPPQIMDISDDPALFRCPGCGSTHDRRWFAPAAAPAGRNG
jgi:hypothetical protein